MSSKALVAVLILLTASPAFAYDLSKDFTRDLSKDSDKTVGMGSPNKSPSAFQSRQPRSPEMPTSRLPASPEEWKQVNDGKIDQTLSICRGC